MRHQHRHEGNVFASPRQVTREQCLFYHSFDLPDDEVIIGDWDMRGRFDDYVGHLDFSGKRVLDVGTASGFLSFEAESRGATVVSLDADSTGRYSRLPFRKYWDSDEMEKAIQEDDVWLEGVKNSFWYAHSRLRSRNRAYYGNVLELPTALGTFDVVLIGQFLVHNRSAVEVLESLAKICTGTMVITEGISADERPVAHLLADPNCPDRWYTWWTYSLAFYRNILGVMGFDITAHNTNSFKCNVAEHPSELELTTIVAEIRNESKF